MIGYDDPELSAPDEFPPAPPLSPDEMAERLAETRALATDEEVEWLVARVFGDHGLELREPWMIDAMRMQAGFAARQRMLGIPPRWLYRACMDLYVAGGDPEHDTEVEAFKRAINLRLAERMTQMSAPGWRP